MEITKEYLQGQMAGLKQQREETIGLLGGVNGAIQLCGSLLEYLEGGESPPLKKDKDVMESS